MAALFRRRPEKPARAERVRLDDKRAERPMGAVARRTALAGLLAIAVFLVVLELIFPAPAPGTGIQLEEGQVAREEIVAPFDFDVLRTPQELEELREWEASQVFPVFEYDPERQTEQRQRFGELLSRVYRVREGPESERQKLDMIGELGVSLSDTTREILLDEELSTRVEELAREILLALAERGVVGSGAPDLAADESVMYLENDTEEMAVFGQFLSASEVASTVREEALRILEDESLAEAVVEIVSPFVVPNVFYRSGETERRREAARQSVEEKTETDVKKNEVIVHRGERITEDHLRMIYSMDRKQTELLRQETGPRRLFAPIGRILQALAILGAFILYLSERRPAILYDTRSQLIFLALVIVVMLIASPIVGLGEVARYLVPVALLAMLLSMLFDLEFAVISTVFVVLLAAAYGDFAFPFVFISTAGGVVAAHSMRRVRHREDFYWSGMRVIGAYAAAIAITDLVRADVSLETLTRAGWGGLNAVVSMGVVVVALPLFERGFRVTTDMTLLELGDMNKPLLRKMAMTAPGTYHHSIILGNLSEAAAEAIDANGLLARVGAYYHDIGKLVTPGYFVENQQGLEPSQSKHTGVRPKVSSLVIRSHIRDGVELARKEKLPEPLIDIIREHHGTTVMEYFYNRAVEEAEDPSEVSAEDYSYPGPKPRSKESAIIALADTIEARIRSIDEPLNQKRIEAEIDEVIQRRWQDHQLDDAELTLSDLRRIRDAFSRVLVGMYHQRVKYPDQGDEGADQEGDARKPRDSKENSSGKRGAEHGGAGGAADERGEGYERGAGGQSSDGG
ncbi:MAG: HDIG domain-containing protein, partial [Candidatus Eisenbacteria bacterium]|nr:HDIG domain-containing protein [Candidatus Eisenbacteria bacterium]